MYGNRKQANWYETCVYESVDVCRICRICSGPVLWMCEGRGVVGKSFRFALTFVKMGILACTIQNTCSLVLMYGLWYLIGWVFAWCG